MAPIFGSMLLSRASFILVISAFSAACCGVGTSCAGDGAFERGLLRAALRFGFRRALPLRQFVEVASAPVVELGVGASEAAGAPEAGC